MTEEMKVPDGAPAGVSDSMQLLGKEITDTIISFVARQVTMIEDSTPLSLEFETDARHVWPDRWTKLKALLVHLGT